MDQTNEINSNQEDEISLVDLLVVLLKHSKLIIIVTIAASIISIAYSIISILLPPEISYLPNLYTSSTSLLFSEQSNNNLSSMLSSSGLGSIASLAGVKAGGSSNTELAIAILKSNTTIDELNEQFDFIGRYNLKADSKTAMRSIIVNKLSATIDSKTGLLKISFTDINAEFSSLVTSRIVEILDRRFMSLGGNKSRDEKRLLETKLNDVRSEIDRLQDEMNIFTSRHGVLSVEAMATEQVTVMAKLRAELIMKDIEIENYKKFSTIDDPVIRRLKSERDSINTALGEVESGNSGVLPRQKDIPAIAFEYAKIQRDILVQNEIFKMITQQYEMAKMSAELQYPTFQVLEIVEVPDVKSGPSRSKIVLVSIFAAFFFSIFCSFLLEFVRNLRADPIAIAKIKGALL